MPLAIVLLVSCFTFSLLIVRMWFLDGPKEILNSKKEDIAVGGSDLRNLVKEEGCIAGGWYGIDGGGKSSNRS